MFRRARIESNIQINISTAEQHDDFVEYAPSRPTETSVSAKSEYEISTCFANIQSICSEYLPGYVWDEYRESLRMSTYLLAFVVMDFRSISDGSFSVWTRSDAIESARYALSIGPKILKFYEGFFNIPYPLPKVDMISLPDFTAGGKFDYFWQSAKSF